LAELEDIATSTKADKAKPRLYGDNMSLTERTRRRIVLDDCFEELREAYATRLTCRDVWEDNRSRWKEEATEAMRFCIDRMLFDKMLTTVTMCYMGLTSIAGAQQDYNLMVHTPILP
jgi:hypothetical protein